MPDIVNLRRARKARLRADRELEAGQRRVAFGTSKAQRDSTRAVQDLADRALDSHRRDGRASPPDSSS